MVPKLAAATRRASALLRRLRPQVVVSVGGYASLPDRARGPPARRADRRRQLRPPARAGQHADGPPRRRLRRGLPDSPLPRAVVTGAPVRRRILAVDRRRRPCRGAAGAGPARRPLRRRRHRRLAGLVGAQRGRRRVRRRATTTTPAWPCARSSATGSSPPRRPRGDGSDGVLHQVVGYDDRIELVYAAADLLVGRGGASTVAEVAVTGHPGDPRAVVGRRRGPPDAERAVAVRPGRGDPAPRGRARRAR